MPSAQKLQNQNRFLTLLSLLFLVISLLLGLQLVNERQLMNKKASTPSGTVNLSLSGPSTTVPGQTLPVNISLAIASSPNDKGITGASLSFTYPNTSAVSAPEIITSLPSPWVYPIKETTSTDTTTTVTISALYFQQGTTGFVSSTPFVFATLNFPTLSEGSLALTYDAANSYIYSKDDPTGSQTSIDILNSSSVSNTFTIALAPTTTPVPTLTLAPTATITIAATPTLTLTPIPSGSPTITPTPAPGTAEPNSCGGTCGSNLNCKSGLACYFDAALKQKVCRNPLDYQSTNCTVRKSTPTPTKKPASGTPRPTTATRPTTRPATTPVYYEYPTPTLFLEPLPTIFDNLPTQPGSTSPLLARIVMVAGMWILVILLIIWLVKKYQDHKSQEKTVSELVNRFKTPESPTTPPTPSK